MQGIRLCALNLLDILHACRSIREIRRDMHKQREWRNELEKMKIGNVVGSLSVESKTLRASLVPVTQRTLEQVGHGATIFLCLHIMDSAPYSTPVILCFSAQA